MEEVLSEIETTLPTLNGWCPVEKGKWLATWVILNRPKLCVEIGVFAGRSLLALALACKLNNKRDDTLQSRVYGIDPYTREAVMEGEQDKIDLDWWRVVDLDIMHQDALGIIKRYNLKNVAEVIVDRSENVSAMFDDGSIGLLHVDGNHSEVASMRDVELYLPKVAPGGVVILDDTDWATNQAARRRLTNELRLLARAKKWEVFVKEGPPPELSAGGG